MKSRSPVMKILAILLSFSLLLCGCYTETSLTKEEPAPDNSKVFYYLRGGSYVKSPPKQHHRVEAGYQVTGTKVTKGKISEKFDGVVKDDDIEKIGAEEFNLWGTVGLVGGAILLVGGIYALGQSWHGINLSE
jgi:hypothetical protein